MKEEEEKGKEKEEEEEEEEKEEAEDEGEGFDWQVDQQLPANQDEVYICYEFTRNVFNIFKLLCGIFLTGSNASVWIC